MKQLLPEGGCLRKRTGGDPALNTVAVEVGDLDADGAVDTS